MKNGSQQIPNIATTDVIIFMDFFFLAIKFSSLPSSLLPGIKDSKYKVQPLRLLSSPKSYVFFCALVWSRSSFYGPYLELGSSKVSKTFLCMQESGKWMVWHIGKPLYKKGTIEKVWNAWCRVILILCFPAANCVRQVSKLDFNF